VNGPPKPSWERLAFWLLGTIIALELLASLLPRLLVPLIILAAIAALLRWLWFYTNR
jgi:hypothetical protein